MFDIELCLAAIGELEGLACDGLDAHGSENGSRRDRIGHARINEGVHPKRPHGWPPRVEYTRVARLVKTHEHYRPP